MSDTPTHFRARATWVKVGNSMGVDVSEWGTAILRSKEFPEDEIVMDLQWSRYRYDIALRRLEEGGQFRGRFTCREGAVQTAGTANGRLFRDTGSDWRFLLLGRWDENREELRWWVEMELESDDVPERRST